MWINRFFDQFPMLLPHLSYSRSESVHIRKLRVDSANFWKLKIKTFQKLLVETEFSKWMESKLLCVEIPPSRILKYFQMQNLGKRLLRRKVISAGSVLDTPLKRCLTTFDLSFLGVGYMVGAGIYVLTGNYFLLRKCLWNNNADMSQNL